VFLAFKGVQVRRNGKARADFQQSEVDPGSVPYKDPVREKARQKALKESRSNEESDRGKAATKRTELKAAVEQQGRVADKKVPAAKRQLMQVREDLKELEDDYRLLRKLKRGKASNKEYEQSIGLAG
jgi:ATP-dependent RNA helicase DDX55/SPB4